MKDKLHQDWHINLLATLDDLVSDYCLYTGKYPSNTYVWELMAWAKEQAKNPTDTDKFPSIEAHSIEKK